MNIFLLQTMNVCIYDQSETSQIVAVCQKQQLRHTVLSDEIAARFDQSLWLQEFHVIVIEATQPTPAVHFLLAQAILLHKPTLCLYKKNRPPRALLAFIRRQKAPRIVRSLSYTADTLIDGVDKFFELHHPHHPIADHLPTMKFTIRLTPALDRYLEWASAKYRLPKADFLRDVLTRTALHDQDYQLHQQLSQHVQPLPTKSSPTRKAKQRHRKAEDKTD